MNALPSPEQLLSAIAHRRSMGLSRIDPDKPVPQELIQMMLEAANWGQSNGDTEPWRFTVFTGEGRNELAEIYGAAFLANYPEPPIEALEGSRARAFMAPVWIAIGMQPGDAEHDDPAHFHTEELMAVATAVQNLHLMASSLGLAGMWHSKGPSISPVVEERLGYGAPGKLVGFFFCGWPNTDWPQGERRALDDKVRWVTE